ncbi:MAG: 23S rRNA (pseudouridine(1915)-N(3))-methyltransferase RlmH [Clostridiales bacterium]|jgi:23S rRNA (pseudouridine1915-N3)-methyltransferase|nr:23S rRNA (pseudouridine(1915)-N(3))-methyltransferase RlmH [Clostridiales bacterium]
MKFRIITVGKLKEKYLAEACAEYVKRLSPYAAVEVIEIPESEYGREAAGDVSRAVAQESAEILKRITAGATVVLDCDGENPSSPELSAKLNFFMQTSAVISFVIGGSHGLTDGLKTRADYRLSFGKMTYPHQLMRVMLLEQLYRACMINANRAYHK